MSKAKCQVAYRSLKLKGKDVIEIKVGLIDDI